MSLACTCTCRYSYNGTVESSEIHYSLENYLLNESIVYQSIMQLLHIHSSFLFFTVISPGGGGGRAK